MTHKITKARIYADAPEHGHIDVATITFQGCTLVPNADLAALEAGAVVKEVQVNGLSALQAQKLRGYIANYLDDQKQAQFAGTQLAPDAKRIREAAENSRANLYDFIREVTL